MSVVSCCRRSSFDGQKKTKKKSIKSRFFIYFLFFGFFFWFRLPFRLVENQRETLRCLLESHWPNRLPAHPITSENRRVLDFNLSLSLSLSLKKINQSIEKKIRAPFFIEFFFGSEFDTNVGNMQIPGTGAWLSGWPADGAWLRCCSDKINQQQTTVWPIQFHQK